MTTHTHFRGISFERIAQVMNLKLVFKGNVGMFLNQWTMFSLQRSRPSKHKACLTLDLHQCGLERGVTVEWLWR